MIIKPLVHALALATAFIIAAAAMRYAQARAIVDAESGRAMMQVLVGLGLAAYANRIPKHGARSAEIQAAMWSQRALRVAGWTMTLAGLGYAAVWALAPVAVADTSGLLLVSSATLLTMIYFAWSLVRCRSTRARAVV